jgi:nitrite reductase/ring-hydroxylating ferredoxin subunit
MSLHAVATTKDIPPGGAHAVEVAGRSIGLFNVDGVIYAIDNICTHDNAPLSEGVVSDGCVVCPWHGAQFDLATGQVLTPPAVEDVRSYEVVVSGDNVCVEIDESSA